jgi:hypothetical protein
MIYSLGVIHGRWGQSFGLSLSAGNIQTWKRIREKAGQMNSTKAYIRNDETSG